MFIDASVIVAIISREPGYEEFEKALNAADNARFYISPLVKFEAVLALARHTSAGGRSKPSAETIHSMTEAVDAFMEGLQAEELSISPEIGKTAITAAAIYGKIVGHPADLNFGDCYAYACAKKLGVKLLYKGNDFAHTDLG